MLYRKYIRHAVLVVGGGLIYFCLGWTSDSYSTPVKHYNSEKTQPSGVSDNPLVPVKACPAHVRAQRRSEACARGNPREKPRDLSAWVTIDSVHRVIWFLIPKAGSHSWLNYFARSVNQTAKVYTNLETFRGLGINMTHYVPLEEFHSGFKDYLRFSVVRHPLQRLVSGYFEIMVKKDKFAQYCRAIRRHISESAESSCVHEPIVSFAEFAVAFSKGFLPQNEHWRQQETIMPCDLHLDLVIKSETDELDARALSKRLGIAGQGLKHIHRGKGLAVERHAAKSDQSQADLTRYDHVLYDLQQKHPETFQWMLDYYAADMDMFGYTWNGRTSGCLYEGHGCC